MHFYIKGRGEVESKVSLEEPSGQGVLLMEEASNV